MRVRQREFDTEAKLMTEGGCSLPAESTHRDYIIAVILQTVITAVILYTGVFAKT